MQYFTPEWHRGDVEDADNHAREEYEKHLAPLLPQWPPDIQRLAAHTSLHDGIIRGLNWDTDAATLHLSIRCGDNQVGYFDLDLHYSEVYLSPPELECLAELDVDRKSEVLYDEVDEEAERFVHRILFISPQKIKGKFQYHELTVWFGRLRLTTNPRTSRFSVDGTDLT